MKRLLLRATLLTTLLITGCQNAAPPPTPAGITATPKPAAPLPAPGEMKISMGFDHPIMVENRLFWLGATKSDYSDRAIYMQEIGSEQPIKLLESTPDWHLGFPNVTGEWLIVHASPASQWPQDAWRLLAKNLRTHEVRELDRATTGGLHLRVSVDAGRVVWLENDWSSQAQSRSRLKMHDLTTNKTQAVLETTAPENIESVSLSGNQIAYAKFVTTPDPQQAQENRFSGDIFLYDLTKGTTHQVSETHDAWQVQIQGDDIVWLRAPHFTNYGNLMHHSLQTGQTKQITQDGLERGIGYPTIGEGFITWWENEPKRSARVYLINKEEIITLDQENATGPIAYGKNLTWRHRQSESEQRIRYLNVKHP